MDPFTRNSPKLGIIQGAPGARNFNINLCKLSEFYGLSYKLISINNLKATEDFFTRIQQNDFLGVGVSSAVLEKLNFAQIGCIKKTAEEGANLLVSVSDADSRRKIGKILQFLTGNAVIGEKTKSARTGLIVSRTSSSITREFTGYGRQFSKIEKYHAFIIRKCSRKVINLVGYVDQDECQPVFLMYPIGKGKIFLLGTEQKQNLENVVLEKFYQAKNFGQTVPLMMFIRSFGAEKVWHRKIGYANFTIDDPLLVKCYGNLNYEKLLRQMEKHKFHTTIAFIPRNHNKSQKDVISLFLKAPDHFSLATHGDDHDGFEFSDQLQGDSAREKRRLFLYERKIAQAITRMNAHKQKTGITYDRVMIFPHRIGARSTLTLLKKYNFLCTVNAQTVPLGEKNEHDFEHNMRPANDEQNFPLVQRSRPSKDSAFDSFIDKPLLLYAHHDFFSAGETAFNPFADRINNLSRKIEWRSLGYISKRLYLERLNDDGSVDVRMFSNHIVLKNYYKTSKLFRVFKKERPYSTPPTVISNGRKVSYSPKNNFIILEIEIQPQNSAVIEIVRSTSNILKPPVNEINLRAVFFRGFAGTRDRHLSRTSAGRNLIDVYKAWCKRLMGYF